MLGRRRTKTEGVHKNRRSKSSLAGRQDRASLLVGLRHDTKEKRRNTAEEVSARAPVSFTRG